MSTIEITNIGAIERARIAAPEGGGLIELRGTHGVGKSTALAAIQTALRTDGRLGLRDGAECGSVSAFGATIRVTAGRTQHGGELLVESVEGRFSLDDLIDPGISDQVRADAARIKALVELSGAKADASLFEDIAPEPIKAKADDLVTLAAKAKAEWEQVARDAEAAQANALDKAKRESPPEGAVVAGAVDSKELHERQRRAAARCVELVTADNVAAQAEAKHERAAEMLRGINLDELETAMAAAGVAESTCMSELEHAARIEHDLEKRLAEAKATRLKKSRDLDVAKLKLDAAKIEFAAAESLKSALQASVPPHIPGDQIESAKREVNESEEAIRRNDEILRNVEQLRKAAEHFALADAHGSRAKKYREAAAAIDRILSGVVQGMSCRLSVQDGRIVLDTHRGRELFGDLSHGERTLEAIDVALSILPSGGILVVSQETYGGLNNADKRELATKAKARGVFVVSAVVTEDEQLSAIEVQ